MACGHISFCAGAPSITGGSLMKVSSSLGNLKPASLNALPKSFNLGKSTWQVLQEVPYWREKAGMAWLYDGNTVPENTNTSSAHMRYCTCILPPPIEISGA